MDKYIILKRFGILQVNKKVLGHRATTDLYHIFYGGGWHCVPVDDVVEI